MVLLGEVHVGGRGEQCLKALVRSWLFSCTLEKGFLLTLHTAPSGLCSTPSTSGQSRSPSQLLWWKSCAVRCDTISSPCASSFSRYLPSHLPIPHPLPPPLFSSLLSLGSSPFSCSRPVCSCLFIHCFGHLCLSASHMSLIHSSVYSLQASLITLRL